MLVTSFSIVKRLDVVRDVGSRKIAVSVYPLLDAFLLEATEEGLSDGIIPTVSSPAHAGL